MATIVVSGFFFAVPSYMEPTPPPFMKGDRATSVQWSFFRAYPAGPLWLQPAETEEETFPADAPTRTSSSFVETSYDTTMAAIGSHIAAAFSEYQPTGDYLDVPKAFSSRQCSSLHCLREVSTSSASLVSTPGPGSMPFADTETSFTFTDSPRSATTPPSPQSDPAPKAAPKLGPRVLEGERCEHRRNWRRIRAKRGCTQFYCSECNAKWRMKAPPRGASGEGVADADSADVPLELPAGDECP